MLKIEGNNCQIDPGKLERSWHRYKNSKHWRQNCSWHFAFEIPKPTKWRITMLEEEYSKMDSSEPAFKRHTKDWKIKVIFDSLIKVSSFWANNDAWIKWYKAK